MYAVLSRTSLFLLLIFFSCSAKVQIGEEWLISEANMPEWVTQPYTADLESAKAFCGTSHMLIEEADARADALRNVRTQIIDALGTAGKHAITEVISVQGLASDILTPIIKLNDSSEWLSEAKISSKAREFHIERWQRRTNGGVETYYKVYVLVLFDNRDAQRVVSEALTGISEQNNGISRDSVDRAIKVMEQLRSEDW
jgi:hypothetical protein